MNLQVITKQGVLSQERAQNKNEVGARNTPYV